MACLLFHIVLVSAFFLVGQGHALKCQTCKPGPQATSCVFSDDYTEVTCASNQDTCFKYQGDVIRSSTVYKGLTTRGCAIYSALQRYQPGTIAWGKCSNVTTSRDPGTGDIYTGRYCLCSGNLCNTAFSSVVSSGLMIGSVLVLTVMWGFRMLSGQ